MTRDAAAHEADARTGGGFAPLTWVALLLAFSPTLADLAGHLAERPIFLYALVFVPLFVRCALRDAAPPARDGWLLVLVGLAAELVALFLGAVRMGRVGLALAAAGTCRLQGLAGWRTIALLALAIPLPASVVRIASPKAQVWMLDAAAALLGGRREGYAAIFEAGRLQLTPFDNGMTQAVLIAGLVWYDGTLGRRPLPGVLVRMALFAPLGFVVQALAVLVTAGLASVGQGDPARSLLTFGPWLLVATVGVAAAERRRQGSGSRG